MERTLFELRYKKPCEVVKMLRKMNPIGKFWVEGDWVMTDMPLRKIRLNGNASITSHNGKNFLKLEWLPGIYQQIDIINPKGRNLYNRY